MINTAWEILYANFKTFLDETVQDNVVVPLVQNPAGVNYKNVPESIINGSYTINFGGINTYNMTASKIIDFDIDVVLDLTYTLNVNDAANSYNKIIQDVETIIAMRIDTTYYESELISVQLKQCLPPIPLGTDGTQLFRITFTVTGRVNL
jgi:hypothetical protein